MLQLLAAFLINYSSSLIPSTMVNFFNLLSGINVDTYVTNIATTIESVNTTKGN